MNVPVWKRSVYNGKPFGGDVSGLLPLQSSVLLRFDDCAASTYLARKTSSLMDAEAM